MLIREIKEQYANRKYIIKQGDFSPVDTSNENMVYVGSLKTEKYDTCEVSRVYVFDQLPTRTVVIYTPNVPQC